jgi:hypothetical protein
MLTPVCKQAPKWHVLRSTTKVRCKPSGAQISDDFAGCDTSSSKTQVSQLHKGIAHDTETGMDQKLSTPFDRTLRY